MIPIHERQVIREHHGSSLPEPPPVLTETQAVWPLVIADMHERDRWGQRKYGMPLQVENGRDHLWDAYQEALDLVVYLRAEIEKRRVPQSDRDVAARESA